MISTLMRILFSLSLLFVCYFDSYAQISAPAADHTDSTTYLNEDQLGKDPIFLFYSPGKNGWPIKGTLVANLEGTDSLNFRWYSFNETSLAFDQLLFSQDTVSSSTLSESTEDGYLVHIFNSKKNIDTAFYAWVFIDEFQISGISVYSSTCERMELKTNLQFDTDFIYHDRIEPTQELRFSNQIETVAWEATPEVSIPATLNPGFEAPTVETSYRITLTDRFGTTRTKNIDILKDMDDGNGNLYLKAVKADFSASRAFIPEGETDTTGQAPLKIMFINKSENNIDNHWVFYKHPDWQKDVNDTLLYESFLEEPIDSILYDKPPKVLFETGYDVALEVKGPKYIVSGEEQQCTDYLKKLSYIMVDSTSMPELPNVFTPNGDQLNEYFGFDPNKKPKSISKFSIKIYNRWGDKVYEYEDNTGDWSKPNGWKGDTRGFGLAKPGVYFYVIIAEGYNNRTYKKKGFVHLFR